MKIHEFLFGTGLLITACALTACGGGGGGDGGATTAAASGGSTPATYGLAGAVNGLSSSSVVLSDGVQPSSNSVTVQAATPAVSATPFSFKSGATYLSAGATYDITLQQQPTGARCAVASATGTVAANVTNLAVNCVAPSVAALVDPSTYAAALGATSQSLFADRSVAVDGAGNVYAADTISGKLLKILPSGSVSVLALTDASTGAAITAPAIQMVAVTQAGKIYVAATSSAGGAVIETINSANVVTTLAGSGSIGATDGSGTAASFGGDIAGLAVDASGTVYVADAGATSLPGNRIRKVTAAGVVTTLAGSSAAGAANGAGAAASFNLLGQGSHVAVDTSGNVYVVEWPNEDVRMITAAGAVTTLAGSPTRAGTTDGAGASTASFANPHSIATDGAGNVYVVDGTGAIRMILPNGVVSTLLTSGSAVVGANNNVVQSGGYDLDGIVVAADGTIYASATVVATAITAQLDKITFQ